MNIDYKVEPITDQYVKDFRVNNVFTLFRDESANKERKAREKNLHSQVNLCGGIYINIGHTRNGDAVNMLSFLCYEIHFLW